MMFIAGAVRGLVSEGGRIMGLVRDLAPDAIALSLPESGLVAFSNLGKVKMSGGGAVNAEEKAYMRGLSAFGKVIKPAPCFLEPWKHAIAENIPIVALDMDDEHYTAAYCKYVGTLDMIRQGRMQRLFARHRFVSKTPKEFVVEWDRLVNRLDGYRALENAREEWLAKGAARLSVKYSRPVVIIEQERLGGVKNRLARGGCEFKLVH